jgi:hypothetical protein
MSPKFMSKALRLAVILLALAGAYRLWQWATDRPSVEIPRCHGLECSDQADCGSRCRCELPNGAKLGRCVAR